MINDNVRKLIEDTLLIITHDEFPWIYEYLSDIAEEMYPDDNAYEIATRLLAEREDSEAIYTLIVELLESEIEEGNDDAMNTLGALYYEGRGVPQSYKKAVHYYEMAAEKGNEYSTENLGYCYYYGRDMDVDYEKAYKYFAIGAFHGRVNSLYKIGDMFKDGKFVKKDEKEAWRVYNHALSLITSDELASEYAGPVYLRVGTCLLKGIGTDVDPKGALVCLQKAEVYLYEMVEHGNRMYYQSYLGAIELGQKAREMMAGKINGVK